MSTWEWRVRLGPKTASWVAGMSSQRPRDRAMVAMAPIAGLIVITFVALLWKVIMRQACKELHAVNNLRRLARRRGLDNQELRTLLWSWERAMVDFFGGRVGVSCLLAVISISPIACLRVSYGMTGEQGLKLL